MAEYVRIWFSDGDEKVHPLDVETKSRGQVKCNTRVSLGAFDVCGGEIDVCPWVRGTSVVNVECIFCFGSSEHDWHLQLQGHIVIHDDIVRLELC